MNKLLTNNNMTIKEVKALFTSIVDDENLEDTTVNRFCNNAFNALWLKRPWEIAKKSDDTKTVVNNQISFPTGFLKPLPIFIDDLEVLPIKREDRRKFKDVFRYYIDWVNSKFVLTSTPTSSTTVYIDFIYNPGTIFSPANENTDIETLVPGFLEAFQPLLAYETAKMFYYQEVGSKNDNWTLEMQGEYERLFNLMASWDAGLKSDAQNTSIPNDYSGYRDNVIE